MLRIFVGYDQKEVAAWNVLTNSIIERSSLPISFTPIVRQHLQHDYHRPRGPLESTDFSMTRFLVPYLCGYHGFALYMDCDMLCRTDISEILKFTRGDHAVWVAKHEYTPKNVVKMGGQTQTSYVRKNWSSLMYFNNEKCVILSPEYVETAQGLDLHRFAWLRDGAIGSLPLEWNWLVGEYPKNPNAKILHYTLGGPWLRGHKNGEGDEEWVVEFRKLADMKEK